MTKYCLQCDYALTGLVACQCPECGRAFNPDDPATYGPFPREVGRRSWLLRAAMPLAVVVIGVNLVLAVQTGRALRGSDYFVIGAIAWAALFWMERRYLSAVTQRIRAAEAGCDYATALELRGSFTRSWRPLFLLLRLLTARGGYEVQYAIALYTHGRIDDALAMAERAHRRARKSSSYRIAASDIRAKALMQLRRYDEARAQSQAMIAAPASRAYGRVNMAILAISLGKLDEAVAQAKAALEDDASAMSNEARAYCARALSLQGRFDEALAMLDAPFVDAVSLVGQKRAQQLMMTAFGRQQLESIRRNYAATIVPMLRHQAALVHLYRGDFVRMSGALAEASAATPMGTAHPWMRHDQLGLQAVCAAGRGDAAAAGASVEAMRRATNAIASEILEHNTNNYAGLAALHLGRFDEAVELLAAAVATGAHPMDRHRASYWLAVAAERAGKPALAHEHFERVMADGFDTWMNRAAGERAQV